MHIRIIRIDPTPEVMESNPFMWFNRKKSTNANIMKQIQMGRMDFLIKGEDRR
jgi:hypothetical protein